MVRFSFPDPYIFAATTSKTYSGNLLDIPKISTFPTIFMNQTHGADCAIITEHQTSTILETDAVITTLPNLNLVVKTADCLPILLWHPSGIIGALHAGRVGTRQKILKKTLRLLKTHFNLHQDIHLYFGPAICAACYPIQQNPIVHFDLKQENTAQALEVFPESAVTLHYSERCTAHEPEFFHSYRRDGKGVPMNYSIICRTV